MGAQSLYLAIGLSVANLRKIISFMREARQDARNKRWYVLHNPSRPYDGNLPLGALGYADELDMIEEFPHQSD